MASITIKAPAKINLFLKILNKRKDSYHNILTLFERISLTDEVQISKIRKGIEVFSDRFITRDPRDNLAFKAAQLIMSKKRLKAGVRIFIKKRIPVAAGMGGGSSDAASALVGINRLFKLRFGEKELARLAGQLGADCPFFISNKPFAIGRSRGD
ncbi:MAG: 4-(cytidine 5'-diphospho)-2-C-methyl-D-erythritol kinase, partial [Candidatus Omnitrophota bacterium]|nr:4-(cytidine 5'-diphospho)-2-C-methyl-D-erythritol kinase [Candidatus Omnitrophota bacterium]